MSCVKICNTSTVHHSHKSMLFIGCIAHCILSLKKNELNHCYQKEVQEQMKADTEALKEQMATMMEAIMSIKEIMEVNAAAIAATSTIAEVDLTPPYGLNQINHPTSDMVGMEGKELGGTGGPHLA